uniref:XRE family transcriptional regulator n=1 Tax=Gracilinema caldarium TaxID=215591 RepID=A0A7C3EJW4_9SPIR
MKYLQKKRNAKIPNMEQGIWLNYLLRTAGYSQKDIAEKAGVSRQMVQKVLYGLKTSRRIQTAIAEALGYKTWAEVLVIGRRVAA